MRSSVCSKPSRKHWPPLKVQPFVSEALFIWAAFVSPVCTFSTVWILTCHTEMNEGTGLVLPVLLVDCLDVVTSCILHWHPQDHQLVLQSDGSVQGRERSHWNQENVTHTPPQAWQPDTIFTGHINEGGVESKPAPLQTHLEEIKISNAFRPFLCLDHVRCLWWHTEKASTYETGAV